MLTLLRDNSLLTGKNTGNSRFEETRQILDRAPGQKMDHYQFHSAVYGQLGKSRELTKRAVDSALRAESKENGAIWQANSALGQAAYGDSVEARQAAAKAVRLGPSSLGAEPKPRLRWLWRAMPREPSPWPKTWENASRWTRR